MIYSVRFAPEAQDQLDAIEEYIALASRSPTVAAHFVDEIVAYCESFETFPERGTRRDDLLPGLHIIGYRKTINIAPKTKGVTLEHIERNLMAGKPLRELGR